FIMPSWNSLRSQIFQQMSNYKLLNLKEMVFDKDMVNLMLIQPMKLVHFEKDNQSIAKWLLIGQFSIVRSNNSQYVSQRSRHPLSFLASQHHILTVSPMPDKQIGKHNGKRY
ncbi:hypothetical protein AABB24_033696, partial [Solanum stoloniferum]